MNVVVAEKAVNVLEAEAWRLFRTRLASSSSSSRGAVVRVGEEDWEEGLDRVEEKTDDRTDPPSRKSWRA